MNASWLVPCLHRNSPFLGQSVAIFCERGTSKPKYGTLRPEMGNFCRHGSNFLVFCSFPLVISGLKITKLKMNGNTANFLKFQFLKNNSRERLCLLTALSSKEVVSDILKNMFISRFSKHQWWTKYQMGCHSRHSLWSKPWGSLSCILHWILAENCWSLEQEVNITMAIRLMNA